MTNKGPKARLVLSDNSIFHGYAFGETGEQSGEVVFNTGMTGYQEILTDPSYKGQIVVMTYPLIGNYGVNREDLESQGPFVEGFVIRELAGLASNFRSSEDLASYMKFHGVLGIQGVDTRAITKKLRVQGSLNGLITTSSESDEDLCAQAAKLPSMEGLDLAKDVTCKEASVWTEGMKSDFSIQLDAPAASRKWRVVVIDYGVKWNILRHLVAHGCEVEVVPANTSAEDILTRKPDGVFLSNGPGDPAAVTYSIETVRNLLGKTPIFGICLGHQILALALGGKTYKLKFGHHGCNHPVKDLTTNKVEITSQNHGFAADVDSLASRQVEMTHINLNDDTVEGIKQEELNVFSVQYHPESSPGPHDSAYLFKRFINLMEKTSSS